MRLIDADKLYDDLADKLKWLMGYGDDVYLSVGDDIRCAVANQPTAYDPERVVDQLNDKFRVVRTDEDLEWNRAMDEAITIVKGDGVDGN